MNNFISLKIKKEKGITLVLALLLTGTVTIAALIIAALLVRELRLTDNIRKSLIAYYGAESGLESALYDHKNGDWPPSSPGEVGDVSSWKITESLGTTEMQVSLPWETTKEIPLYNSNGSLEVETINFCWSPDCGAAGPYQLGGGPTAIEWTLLTVHQNEAATKTWLEPGPRGAEINRGILDCGGDCSDADNKEVTLDLSSAIPDWEVGGYANDRHVLRFKHIRGNNDHTVTFQITMEKADGNKVSFNQETAFKVTGTAAGSDISRALDVAITPQSPAYNVFDYVIFSDTYVGKDAAAPGATIVPTGTVQPPLTPYPSGSLVTPAVTIINPTLTPIRPTITIRPPSVSVSQ